MHALQQDGAVAPIKIKLRHGDTLIIDTLVGTVQVNALRRFLAEGFQIHLQQNPLLHQILNFEPREERAERLTPLEKKLYRLAPFHVGFPDQKNDWPVCPLEKNMYRRAAAHVCFKIIQCVCICNNNVKVTLHVAPCMWGSY